MPGLLVPALCFGSGALIGIGLFVALNSDMIRDKFNEAVEEQRMYWEAIQTVRAQRQEARRNGEKREDDRDEELEKAVDLFRATESSAHESDAEPDMEVRHRFTERTERAERANQSGSSSNEASSPGTFAVYTIVPTSSSDEDEEDGARSDENEFSSYDKLDSSDLSSY